MVHVRPATPADAAVWLTYRCDLFYGSEDEHRAEIERFFAGRAKEPLTVLVAERDGDVVGMAELSIRPHAEGCRTDQVAYLEAWYVAARARRGGVGRALVEGAEQWAREQGCTELASDTDIANTTSVTAHLALGFADVGTIRCFRKALDVATQAPRGLPGK